jgi:hypothetical protein
VRKGGTVVCGGFGAGAVVAGAAVAGGTLDGAGVGGGDVAGGGFVAPAPALPHAVAATPTRTATTKLRTFMNASLVSVCVTTRYGGREIAVHRIRRR